MSDLTQALAGHLWLQPGQPVTANLSNTRRNWVPMIAPGRKASALPDLLAGLFSLCGMSHRTCAELAVSAALGADQAGSIDTRSLQIETVCEHLRRIALDWPRLLGGQALPAHTPDSRWQSVLSDCPTIHHRKQASGGDTLSRTQDWLSRNWLDTDARQWLAAWERDRTDWLRVWAGRVDNGLSHLINTAMAIDLPHDTTTRQNALQWERSSANKFFSELSAQLFAAEQFALRPTLTDGPAQTGTWTRHHDCGQIPARPVELLGARVAELIRLCLPDMPHASGTGWLAWGCAQPAPLQGIAWLEMARGVLIHAVQLDKADPAEACVVRCSVVAPTEWNFHPAGVVAQHLSRLDPADPTVDCQLGLLMAAYDPCVPFSRLPATADNDVGSNKTKAATAGNQYA